MPLRIYEFSTSSNRKRIYRGNTVKILTGVQIFGIHDLALQHFCGSKNVRVPKGSLKPLLDANSIPEGSRIIDLHGKCGKRIDHFQSFVRRQRLFPSGMGRLHKELLKHLNGSGQAPFGQLLSAIAPGGVQNTPCLASQGPLLSKSFSRSQCGEIS